MMSRANSDAWVGLKDHIVEGDWRLLNGERFDPNDHSQPKLYFWGPGEPNSNGNEDCAAVCWAMNDIAEDEAFNDVSCQHQLVALCEMKHDTCL